MKQEVFKMSRRKIKEKKPNRHKAKFRSINIPVNLWSSYIDFLWGSVLNVTPGTLNNECISFIKSQVFRAMEEGTVKIKDNKIIVK